MIKAKYIYAACFCLMAAALLTVLFLSFVGGLSS